MATPGRVAGMESVFTALDTVFGLLFAGALSMIAFTHRELKAARLILVLAAVLLAARWSMWAILTQTPWWGRAIAGAVVGGVILGGLPALWHWSRERAGISEEGAPFAIEFPDSANDPATFPASPFARFVNIGVLGAPVNNFISRRSFLFRVKNETSKTANDIKESLFGVFYENGVSEQPSVPLIAENGFKSLNPGESGYVQFIEFLDNGWAGGLFETQFVDQSTLDELRFITRPGLIDPLPMGSRVLAIPKLGGFGIQKPVNENKVYFDVAIYAENFPPTYVRFLLTGEPIRLHLIAQGKSLPKLK